MSHFKDASASLPPSISLPICSFQDKQIYWVVSGWRENIMGWSRWVTCSAVFNSTGLVGSLHTGLRFVISVVCHGPGEKRGQLHGVINYPWVFRAHKGMRNWRNRSPLIFLSHLEAIFHYSRDIELSNSYKRASLLGSRCNSTDQSYYTELDHTRQFVLLPQGLLHRTVRLDIEPPKEYRQVD